MHDEFKEYDPRNVNLDKPLRDKYDDLSQKKGGLSPFKELTEVFFFSAIIGFINKKREPLKSRYPSINYKTGFTPEEKWIMRAMVISEAGDLELLATEESQREILKIIEEYSNGGIKLLHYMILGGKLGDYHKRLEQDLRNILNKRQDGRGDSS